MDVGRAVPGRRERLGHGGAANEGHLGTDAQMGEVAERNHEAVADAQGFADECAQAIASIARLLGGIRNKAARGELRRGRELDLVSVETA